MPSATNIVRGARALRFREAGDAGRVATQHLVLLQPALQQKSRFGAPGAPPGPEVEAIEEDVECKEPGHEGDDLIEADIQEPRRELRQRPARQVAAAVEITLPRHVGAIHHPLIFAAAFEVARQANTQMSISCGRNRVTTLPFPYAFADAAYAFERIASAKVTIRPRPSSHSAWRDARNPSARVSTDATVKPGCAPWRGMVDVVETDIPCHPLQQTGQPEKRAATQRRVNRVPLHLSCPVGPVEIVL
jgi:hypothetical protein